MLGSDGNFYGTTYSGGTNSCDCGTVFRISPSGTYTSLYSFAGPPDGQYPAAALAEGTDSNFYGTTAFGGTSFVGEGTVFRISPSGTYTSLYSFAGFPDGSLPEAGLRAGQRRQFLRHDRLGRAPCSGTAFRITPSGVETILYSFVGTATNGSAPYCTLVIGSDGNFYGTTAGGGPVNAGTVFKLAVGGGGGNGSTNCTFSINPTNAVFDAAGGSDSVSVTASNGCDWMAISNDQLHHDHLRQQRLRQRDGPLHRRRQHEQHQQVSRAR